MRDWSRQEVLAPILKALGQSKNIVRGHLNYELLSLVFKDILKAVKKNPSCKDYFKDRAGTINSINELRDLAESLQKGVEFADEDVDMDEYHEGLLNQIKKDPKLAVIVDDPFSCGYVDSAVDEFFKMTGMKARKYQIEALKLIMNVATEADMRSTLIQMQTGTGKSFCQSLLANVIVAFNKEWNVLLLHTCVESRNDCYDKYGSRNPLAVNCETQLRKGSHRIYYVDFYSAVDLAEFVKKHQKRLVVIIDEVDTIKDC